MIRPAALPLLALIALSPLAGAQGLDAATRKGIDAHAFQFTGHHCAGGIEAKPAEAMTASRFKSAVRVMDVVLTEGLREKPEVRYRSSFNDKDLFRAFLSGPGKMAFLMMFWQGGRSYVYSCDLK